MREYQMKGSRVIALLVSLFMFAAIGYAAAIRMNEDAIYFHELPYICPTATQTPAVTVTETVKPTQKPVLITAPPVTITVREPVYIGGSSDNQNDVPEQDMQELRDFYDEYGD